jgi:hypothetical protein
MKRYAAFLIALGAVIILSLFYREIGLKALEKSAQQFWQMLLVIPPVFILLGLMDVWVPRETMVKYMGEGSGIKGGILSFIIGSAAAGPLRRVSRRRRIHEKRCQIQQYSYFHRRLVDDKASDVPFRAGVARVKICGDAPFDRHPRHHRHRADSIQTDIQEGN